MICYCCQNARLVMKFEKQKALFPLSFFNYCNLRSDFATLRKNKHKEIVMKKVMLTVGLLLITGLCFGGQGVLPDDPGKPGQPKPRMGMQSSMPQNAQPATGTMWIGMKPS